MALHITHMTRYAFEAPVTYTLQKLRLRPISGPMQTVQDWDLEIEGGRVETSYRDHYGNHVDLLSADVGASEFAITARGTVLPLNSSGVLGQVYGCAPLWHFAQPTRMTRSSPGIAALSDLIGAQDTVLAGMHALSEAILKAVPYTTGATQVDTTADEALSLGKGVCQDHAHLFIAAARHAGIPARYVSGYLKMKDRVDQDASHAWAEAHIPDLGWVGFDVSSGICPDDHYVRLAIGRDGKDAAPISGLRIGTGDETMIVSLQVQQ